MKGAKVTRELELIRLYYENLPKLGAPDQIFEAGVYSQKNQLIDRGIGFVDSMIIFASIQNRKKSGHWTRESIPIWLIRLYKLG